MEATTFAALVGLLTSTYLSGIETVKLVGKANGPDSAEYRHARNEMCDKLISHISAAHRNNVLISYGSKIRKNTVHLTLNDSKLVLSEKEGTYGVR